MTELDVSAERLATLLGQRAESASLEFIADCDLSERRAIVELATEVGALAARGGSLIVGVGEEGQPMGLFDDEKAKLFDEATVRDKLACYLPGSLELRVGRHQIGDGPVILIEIAAHPDGAAVFTADGAFEHKGKQQLAFRRGEFFVRHGTKSELPNQADVHELGQIAVARERLWLDVLLRVQDAVAEAGRVAEAEGGRDPQKPVVGFDMFSRWPTARSQLGGCLAALERAGGPRLPACEELAYGSTISYYGQAMSAVFSAMNEVAGALAQSR